MPARRTPTALAALTVLAAFAATTLAAPLAGAASPTAAGVIAASRSALKGEHGVHLVVTTHQGATTTVAVADIGSSAGRESYASGSSRFSVEVTKKAAYLSGSPTGLKSLMGLSAKQATAVGSKWIVMKKGSEQYKEFWLNLTAKSFDAVLPSASGTRLLAGRDGATGGFRLRWENKATSTTAASTTTLVIAATHAALPLREVVGTASGTSTTVFSHWGERVRIAAPRSTIAYATVFG